MEIKSIQEILEEQLGEGKFDKIKGQDLHIIGDLMGQTLKGGQRLNSGEAETLDKLMTKYNLHGKEKGQTVPGFIEFIKSKGYGTKNESDLEEAKLPDAGETFIVTKDFSTCKKGDEMEVQMVDNQSVTVMIKGKEKTFNSREWTKLPIKMK